MPINYVEMSQIQVINGKVSQTKQSKSKLLSAPLQYVTEMISEALHRQFYGKIITLKKQVVHIPYSAHI